MLLYDQRFSLRLVADAPFLPPAEAPHRAAANMLMSHEEALIRAFIVAEKQERYLELLASPKRRSGFLDRLNHHLDYDPKYAAPIATNQQTASGIERILRQRGAPDMCHTISCHAAWDAQELPLHEALGLIVGFSMGTILCCIPGKLAYYEAEDLHARYILSR